MPFWPTNLIKKIYREISKKFNVIPDFTVDGRVVFLKIENKDSEERCSLKNGTRVIGLVLSLYYNLSVLSVLYKTSSLRLTFNDDGKYCPKEF
jgi:hypothetical protein